MTVGGIDYYITDTFGEGLFDSCKDVKFGTMNSRAIEFVGASAKNFKGTVYYNIIKRSKLHEWSLWFGVICTFDP